MTSAPTEVPPTATADVAVRITRQLAEELAVQPWQVRAAIDLLDGGATVPFVARYRKEVTGTLDDAQLRALEERLAYLRELEERRAFVLESVREQGKLTPELEAAIAEAATKARLEDVYLPFKPKRRTKAQIAREAGLEPLADALFGEPELDPQTVAAAFVDEAKGVPDVAAALAGARAILVERITEDADLVGSLRERVWSQGRLASTVREGMEEQGAKFADYFSFSEPLTQLPGHRILALFRAEKEGVLSVTLEPGDDDYEGRIAGHLGLVDRGRPGDGWLLDTARWAWRTRLQLTLELDLRARLWQAAEDDAVRVFAGNLRDLLLAAPAGVRPTMGLDPGLRTGVKVAVVDGTGKVVDTATVYPHLPHRKWQQSLDVLAALIARHKVELIAIGNGTASRETDKLAGELVALVAKAGAQAPTKVVVSEAGASVYSASAYASQELPGLDVSLRGAVSIARRLQDPLAELVKIDPKSIGVGQYQHDVSGSRLSRSLDAVVEDCVNAVGVDVNTASVPLLARVSGVSESLASSIVGYRESHGPFPSRAALRNVPRLGPKAFEQSAGFLRIQKGDDPLDASGVHPEAYPVVHRMSVASDRPVAHLVGDGAAVATLRAEDFVDETFGLPTVRDILAELAKPGRDPRPAFTTARFKEGVETLDDLRAGMILEGVVTNVAAFGAFVDIGVHQDGLVHISAMSRDFVSNPRDVVKPGDIVKVKVMDVDVARQRIGLSMRIDDELGAGAASGRRGDDPAGQQRGRSGQPRSGHQGQGQPRQGQPRQGQPRQGQPQQGQSGQGHSGQGHSGQGRSVQRGGQGQQRSGQAQGPGGRRGGDGRGRQAEPEGALADAFRRAGFRVKGDD